MSVDLPPLAEDVTAAAVRAQLVERHGTMLAEVAADEHVDFRHIVRSVAVEVVRIVGQDPPAGQVRDYAVETIVVGVAATFEDAHYPEQQLGEFARASALRSRYLGMLAELRAGGATGARAPGPRGSFPPARAYPDPVRTAYPRDLRGF